MSFGPRDPIPGLVVPVDPWTGYPLSPITRSRIERYKEAEREFRIVLHELDGTSFGTSSGDRRMARAFTKLDELGMWVMNLLLDRNQT